MGGKSQGIGQGIAILSKGFGCLSELSYGGLPRTCRMEGPEMGAIAQW